MSHCSRRSVLSGLGLGLPLGLGLGADARAAPPDEAPALRLLSFEDAVRDAFAGADGRRATHPCRRIEVGHSDQVQAGIQGCHNDRPFAGFSAGALRIVRAGSTPGPSFRGVRLYVSWVDVMWTAGTDHGEASRPLDFAALPPAPTFS
jgi:hypothetical protein